MGRGRNWYTVKVPGLPMVSLPFVYLGIKLDDAFGSMNGGQVAGPPIGQPEQPLRWSGRLAISAALIVNAREAQSSPSCSWSARNFRRIDAPHY
jgi:hypothetical protein